MDQSTPEQHAAIRQAAAVRRDYLLWLAKAMERRAKSGEDPKVGFLDALCIGDRDLLREAAAELRALVE